MMLRNPCAFALSRRVIVALTGIAFTILVSVAATHLHIGADADEACAVCAAVAGKLAGPSAAPAVKVSLELVHWLTIIPTWHPLPRSFAVVLPPSCGPPCYS
jgi:hypothetical protein